MNTQEKLVSLKAIVSKETNRVMRIWTQTLLPSAITMTLYFVIFGSFIGSQIANVNGNSYMAFIVPGIVMMAVITNSFTNVVSSFFGNKFQRSIEELLVSPTPNYIIIWGYVLRGVFRGLLIGLIVTLISLFFTKLHLYNVLIIIVFVFLTALVFSLAGFMNAVYAKKFDDVAIIPTFVLTPLTYLGGVFYSITMLPPFWQKVSLLNPIIYMVDGFRYGFLGTHDVNVWIGFFMLVILSVGLFLFNLHLLKIGKGLKN